MGINKEIYSDKYNLRTIQTHNGIGEEILLPVSPTIQELMRNEKFSLNNPWDNSNSYAGAKVKGNNSFVGEYSKLQFPNYSKGDLRDFISTIETTSDSIVNLRFMVDWTESYNTSPLFRDVFRWTGLNDSAVATINNAILANSNYYSIYDPYKKANKNCSLTGTMNNPLSTSFLTSIDINKLIILPIFTYTTIVFYNYDQNTDSFKNVYSNNIRYHWAQIKPEDKTPAGEFYDPEIYQKGYKEIEVPAEYQGEGARAFQFCSGVTLTPYYGNSDSIYNSETNSYNIDTATYQTRMILGNYQSNNYPASIDKRYFKISIRAEMNIENLGIIYADLPGIVWGNGSNQAVTMQTFGQGTTFTFNNNYSILDAYDWNPFNNYPSNPSYGGIYNTTDTKESNVFTVFPGCRMDNQGNFALSNFASTNTLSSFKLSKNNPPNYSSIRPKFLQAQSSGLSIFPISSLWATIASFGLYVADDSIHAQRGQLGKQISNNNHIYCGRMNSKGITDGVMVQGNDILSLPQVNLNDIIGNSNYRPGADEEDSKLDTIELGIVLQNGIDFNDSNFEIGYLPDQLEDKNYFWNESVAEINQDIRDLEKWYQYLNINERDILDKADAAASFEKNIEWVIPWTNYDNKDYKLVRGNDGFLKILTLKDNLQFTRKKDSKWIRLIMPKNTRRVEIEDLNRNFWVIGQTVSQVLRYLFDDGTPLKKIFPKLLSELAQLNDNVLNLWVQFYLMSLKNYSDIKIIFLPIEPYDRYSYENNYQKLENLPSTVYKYPRYDRMDKTGYSKGMWNIFYGDFWKSHTYLINKYPESNLIVIPFIRNNNYKHNYYSRVYFPGIFFYDRNQQGGRGETSGYIFQNKENEDISIDIKNNNISSTPATYVINDLYGIREEEDFYRILKPFSSIGSIEEEVPSKYYGTIRCIPTIEARYDKKIIIDKFKLEFYDAGRQIIEPKIKPLLVLSAENLSSDPNNSYGRDLILKEEFNIPKLKMSTPYNSKTLNNKLYMGEVLSWHGRTTEKENWEFIDKESYTNTGILIKIGNFLPISTVEDNNGDLQTFTYNDLPADVRHQCHVIERDGYQGDTEKTAYEVNLNFTFKDKKLFGKHYQQKECHYYYPSFNKEKQRWQLNQLDTSIPYKSEIISHGLRTIYDYLFNNNTSIQSQVFENVSNVFKTIDGKKIDNGLDLNKVTYFIGAIGMNAWDNTYQFYWARSLLFGVFIFIPEKMLETNDEVREEIYSNYRGRYIEEMDKGLILFRGEINKTENNFFIEDKRQFFYRGKTSSGYNGDAWRLPKVFPREEDITALKVRSLKTNKEWYLPLSNDDIRTYYEEDKESFIQNIGYYRDQLEELDQFQHNAIFKVINKAAGVWTVFDGYTNKDKLSMNPSSSNTAGTAIMNVMGNSNIEENLKNNIKAYNNDNTNRQVCYMDYSIENNSLQCNNLLLRQRTFKNSSLWIPTKKQYKDSFDLFNINGEKVITIFNNIPIDNRGENERQLCFDDDVSILENKTGTNAYDMVWAAGAYYKIGEPHVINPTPINLEKPILGLDISQFNDIDWDSVEPSEIGFIMIRIGYGKTTLDGKDEKFEEFYQKCKEKNIPIGAYWFTYARNENEIRNGKDGNPSEIELCLKILEGKKFDYPIFLDFERTLDFNEDSLDYKEIEEERKNSKNSIGIIKAFIEELEKNGYYSGLYINSNYSKSTGINEELYFNSLIENKKVWWALWKKPLVGDFDSIGKEYGMWQYSDGREEYDDKKFKGFNSNVDRNYCFINYPKMIESFNGSSYSDDILYWDEESYKEMNS